MTAGETRVVWFRRPLLIAIGFVVAGGVYLGVAGIDSSVTVDDGFYQLPVKSLRSDGEWSFDYVLADVDPGGVAAQWSVGSSENGFFTNVRRPLWLLALTGADSAGGIPAQRLLLLGSGAIAVLAAAALAREFISPRAAWIAAVLTALSPIAFNSLQFWAHAPAAAAFSAVLLAALATMEPRTRTPGWMLPLGVVGAALAPALRTDGTIYVAAAAAVTGLTGLYRRRWNITAYGATLAVVGAGSHVITSYALNWITGGPTTASGIGDPTARTLLTRGSTTVASRVEGFVETSLSGFYDEEVAYALLLSAVLCVAYAVVLIRRSDLRSATVVLAIGAILWSVRIVLHAEDFATGLVGAWPVALLVFAEPFRRRSPAEKRIATILALAFVGVVATQYDGGGGLNWGGRFLSSALPGLAVLVAATVTRLRSREGSSTLIPAILGLAAVVTVASLAADWETRTRHDQLIGALEEANPRMPVVTDEQALPNLAWRTYPRIQFVWVRDEAHARIVSDLLVEAGYDAALGFRMTDDVAVALTGGQWTGGDLREPVVLELGR